MSTELFEKIESLQSGEDYFVLAKLVADGEDADPRIVVDACNAAGKTATDFRQLVAKIGSRKAEREKYAQLPGIKEQQGGLRSQIDAANEVLERATDEHEGTCRPLQVEIQRLTEQATRLARIPTELSRTCPDERLTRRLQQHAATAHRLAEAVTAAGQQLLHCEGLDRPDAIERAQGKLDQARSEASDHTAEGERLHQATIDC